MSDFAKAPWSWVQLEFSGYYHELHDADGKVVLDDGSAQGEYSPQIDVKGANARLIAAAPDLLEALEYVADIDITGADDRVLRFILVAAQHQAKAAIAQAKGEQA